MNYPYNHYFPLMRHIVDWHFLNKNYAFCLLWMKLFIKIYLRNVIQPIITRSSKLCFLLFVNYWPTMSKKNKTNKIRFKWLIMLVYNGIINWKMSITNIWSQVQKYAKIVLMHKIILRKSKVWFGDGRRAGGCASILVSG